MITTLINKLSSAVRPDDRLKLRELRESDYRQFKTEIAPDQRPRLEQEKETKVAELLAKLEALENAALTGADNADERLAVLKQIVAVRMDYWQQMRDEAYRDEVTRKLGTQLHERFLNLPTESTIMQNAPTELRQRHHAASKLAQQLDFAAKQAAANAERFDMLHEMTVNGERRRQNSWGEEISRDVDVTESDARMARYKSEQADKAYRAALDEVREIEQEMLQR